MLWRNKDVYKGCFQLRE